MGDTLAFAPAPTAGALSGKRTVGSAPARGTGANRSSDGGGLADGDGRLVVALGELGVTVALVGETVVTVVVAAVVVVVDAEGLAPLLQAAASITAATPSAIRAGLT